MVGKSVYPDIPQGTWTGLSVSIIHLLAFGLLK